MKRLIPLFVAAGVILSAGLSMIPEARAGGGTVLTIAGNITAPNRGPRDDFVDAFLKGHDLNFEKARAFDRDALLELGMHRIVTKYPGTDRVVNVEGPLLRDVLAKAGATKGTVKVLALDGYEVEIPRGDIDTWPVILALKSGDTWLGIGDRGPTWIVYPQDDFPGLADRDDASWVWSVFFITVE